MIGGTDSNGPSVGFAVPALACDCHAHVFGPLARYPAIPGRTYDPPAYAGVAAYKRLHARLGIGRGVLVQPSPYGIDNACLVDALHELGAAYRGIAVFPPEAPDRALDRMDAAGVRGVRIHPLQGLTLDRVEPLAGRIADRGWHLQIFVADSADLVDLAPRVRRLPVPTVFDHMGRVTAERGVSDPGFQALLRLVGDGVAWVKVSWAETLSAKGPPFDDVDPMATALIRANPERAVWGTDWPHNAGGGHLRGAPPQTPGPRPDEAELLALVGRWAPDARTRERILVENPARLYGFGDAPGGNR